MFKREKNNTFDYKVIFNERKCAFIMSEIYKKLADFSTKGPLKR